MVVTKLVSLKNFTSLMPLMREDVKMVHLVRDPRGQILSIRKLGTNLDLYTDMSIDKLAHHICNVLRVGLKLTEKAFRQDSKIRNNYLRVRYEDIAKDPILYNQKLYDFVGLDQDAEVSKWLEGVTNNFSSYSRAWSWRTRIPYGDIISIHRACGDVLDALGYVGALDGGSPCCLSILRNANVACLCRLFMPMSHVEFKKRLCPMSL